MDGGLAARLRSQPRGRKRRRTATRAAGVGQMRRAQAQVRAMEAKVSMWEECMRTLVYCVMLSPEMNDIYKQECVDLLQNTLVGVEQVQCAGGGERNEPLARDRKAVAVVAVRHTEHDVDREEHHHDDHQLGAEEGVVGHLGRRWRCFATHAGAQGGLGEAQRERREEEMSDSLSSSRFI
mgnify:CR=1 FL=1